MISELLRYVITHWPTSFLLTQLVEVPIFVLLSRGETKPGRAALAAVLCSTVTHPLLWHLWRPMFDEWLTYVITGELLVTAVESVIFYLAARPIRLGPAIGAACIANAASFAVGQAIWYALRLS